MGGGAWATACGQVLADAGHNVVVWARSCKSAWIFLSSLAGTIRSAESSIYFASKS